MIVSFRPKHLVYCKALDEVYKENLGLGLHL